jgi:hypothetical protein
MPGMLETSHCNASIPAIERDPAKHHVGDSKHLNSPTTYLLAGMSSHRIKPDRSDDDHAFGDRLIGWPQPDDAEAVVDYATTLTSQTRRR